MKHFHLSTVALVLFGAGSFSLAQDAPYDVIDQGFGKHIDRADPLPWAMKVRSVARGPYEFWRGSRDLFYQYAKTHFTDWSSSPQSLIPGHGDVHFGNVGSYPTAPFGTLAFGLVDFDDAAVQPFQLDLLSVYITSLLVANESNLSLPPSFSADLVDAYRKGLLSDQPASKLLATEPEVIVTLRDAGKKYKKEMEKFTEAGRFKPTVLKDGQVTEVLRRAPGIDRRALAEALSTAVTSSPTTGAVFNYTTPDEFERAILDVALRTRVASSGSQGLDKLLVLMTAPIKGTDSDVIVYLKQQIPAAAERQTLVPALDPTPGRRCATRVMDLTRPAPLVTGAVELAGKSYLLTIKEPWSDELDWTRIDTPETLVRYALLTATTVGSAHGQDGRSRQIAPLLTPDLTHALHTRATAYTRFVIDAHERFVTDTRVNKLRDVASYELGKLTKR